MEVHKILARTLSELGVKHLFALPGDGNLFLVDSYHRELGLACTFATNEANAVLMAAAYSRITGKIGAATITHGGALTNTLTALTEGAKSKISYVLLAGDTAGIDREHIQNVDQHSFVIPTGAGFEQLRSPKTAVEDLCRAFSRARTEARPIVFNMPADFQWEHSEFTWVPLRQPNTRAIVPNNPDLDDAIGIIASAKRPIVLGGRGLVVSGATAASAVLKFAERIGAPTATTLRGKGLFSDDVFNLGIFGTLSHQIALEIINISDCIISFGASLNKFTTNFGAYTRNKRIIHVALSEKEINLYSPATIGLVGDPGLIANQMIDLLNEAEIVSSQCRNEELSEKLIKFRNSLYQMPREPSSNTLDFFRALQIINGALPRNRVLVTDGGRFIRPVWPIIDVQDPQFFIETTSFGAIGLGLGHAIGAALATTTHDQLTVLITGDGGLMLGGLSELVTAAQLKLKLLIIVCNDGAYGAEYLQLVQRELAPTVSLNQWPSFIPIAKTMGFQGWSVSNLDELKTTLESYVRNITNIPAMIEIKLDPAMTPYYYISSAKIEFE